MIVKKFSRIGFMISGVVALFFIYLLVKPLMFKGYSDFPCFSYYDAAKNCIGLFSSYPPIDKKARIQALIDTTQLGWSGGGCSIESSSTDILALNTPAISLKLERHGDSLLVNGKKLNTGKQFAYINYLTLNPWTVEKTAFTNYGPVSACTGGLPFYQDERNHRFLADTAIRGRLRAKTLISDNLLSIYIIGWAGEQISPIKGLLILIVCLWVVFWITEPPEKEDA